LELQKSKLAWAHIDRLLVLPRIPVDRRHNGKVDYSGLDRILKRLERMPLQPVAGAFAVNGRSTSTRKG
jgi:hypothetical protein